MIESGGRPNGKGVGNKHLFKQAHGKNHQTGIDILPVQMPFFQVGILGLHFFMADNGPGKQLGKKGRKKGVIVQNLPV